MAVVFSHLRSFHAVAVHGGFTATAVALCISQPTVTTLVKELENRYGVELLVRHGRRVELTETGAALLAISRRLMKLHEESDELLTSSGNLTTGHLKLAAVVPFHVTEMVARFLSSFPAITVSMLLGNSDQTLQRILELEADVAILAHAVDDPRVFSVPFGSREGVWKAVERGLGIGVVADFEFVSHPRLSTIKIADAEVRTEYRLACLRERRQSPKIDAFLKSGLMGSAPAQV